LLVFRAHDRLLRGEFFSMSAVSPGFLERRFALAARKTSVRIEIVAGITTFLAAAYLLVVIPSLLASGRHGPRRCHDGGDLVFVAPAC